MRTAPLVFPKSWERITKPHFLLGFPFVGAQDAAYRDLCTQLALRTESSWRDWGLLESRTRLARFASATLGCACHWPNPVFVPDDPFILVAWDYTTCGGIDHGDLDEALDTISHHAGFRRCTFPWDTFQASVFGDVIDQLLSMGTPTLLPA